MPTSPSSFSISNMIGVLALLLATPPLEAMARIEAGMSQSSTAIEALVASFEGQAERAPSIVPAARPGDGDLFESQQQVFDAQQQALQASTGCTQQQVYDAQQQALQASTACSGRAVQPALAAGRYKMQHSKGSSDTWPLGVTTASDMQRYAATLFGADKKIEDLLQGTSFAGHPRCFLMRVKDACKNEFANWPELIEKAMEHSTALIGNPDCIQVKARHGGASRRRIYDSMQITSQKCICRVSFGGDKHQQKLETGSSGHASTSEMDKILMGKFKLKEEHRDDDTGQDGYQRKAFHLVLNRYNLHLQDSIDFHQDKSTTYAPTDVVNSVSFV